MPVYNAEKYLSLAIDSIINQLFADWELILVNDGSTDSSEQIALTYTDHRIKYSKNEENKGLIYTRNLMIEQASGEYIAFLDSDDISMPERLTQQVLFLDKNADYGLCGTWCTMIDETGKKMKQINMSVSSDEIKCNLLFANTFVQSSIMIRRDILIRNPYDKEYPLAEDYELWCRLSQLYKMQNLPQHLTLYRWHSCNISKSKKEQLDSLVDKISKRELKNINIDASDYELSIHSSIRDKNIVNLPHNVYLKELRLWLHKVAEYGIQSEKYNKDTLLATIAFRWIFACKERKLYLKALSLPVGLTLQGYLILSNMLRKRI